MALNQLIGITSTIRIAKDKIQIKQRPERAAVYIMIYS